jgi:uroporphyrinogen decarboxylase
VHFGYWRETLHKWADEGHISQTEARQWNDGNPVDLKMDTELGFDFNWGATFTWITRLHPGLETKTVEERPDGSSVFMNENGAFVIKKPGIMTIPTEIDHLLKGRKEWEDIYKPRLRFNPSRINEALVIGGEEVKRFDAGGCESLIHEAPQRPLGLYCGSLLGVIRDWLGLVGMSYLLFDDEPLFDEMVETVADLCYQGVQAVLESGVRFDYGHFWEDICYKGGPLINPEIYASKIGPHYRRITGLLCRHKTEIISLDCDGKIDLLIPIWLENGVNTMFPIEIGTWNASILPWREKYGRNLRGVGGVNKHVFGMDYSAIDEEIERIHPLVELGGYIPCPDHRLPIEARWENVQYYCEKMRKVFG